METIMYLFPTIAWRMEYMSVKGLVKSLATLVRCERLVSVFNMRDQILNHEVIHDALYLPKQLNPG